MGHIECVWLPDNKPTPVNGPTTLYDVIVPHEPEGTLDLIEVRTRDVVGIFRIGMPDFVPVVRWRFIFYQLNNITLILPTIEHTVRRTSDPGSVTVLEQVGVFDGKHATDFTF